MAVDNIYNSSNPAIYKLSAERLESIKDGDFSLNIWEKFKDLFRSGAKQKMIETISRKLEDIKQGPYSDDIIKLKTFQTFREFAKPEDLSKFKIDIQHKTDSHTGEKSWSYSFMINGENIDGPKSFSYNIAGQGLLIQFETTELAASLTANLVNTLTNPRDETPPKDDVDLIRTYVAETVNQTTRESYSAARELPANGSIVTPHFFENLFECFINNKTSLFDPTELSYNPNKGRKEKQFDNKQSRLVYRPEITLKGQTIGSGAAQEPIWQKLQNERIASFSTLSDTKDLVSKTVTQLKNADVKSTQFFATSSAKRTAPNLPLPEVPKFNNSRPTIPLPEIPSSKNEV